MSPGQPRFVNEPSGLPDLSGVVVFLSASVPDQRRWKGEADAFEIMDAVVAAARVILTANARIVTATHPTIAPLMLFVAREMTILPGSEPPLLIYQSEVFEGEMPGATMALISEGWADLHRTPAAPGESSAVDNRAQSLLGMRLAMFEETDPRAAFFIGGMAGIRDEFDLFRTKFPDRPVYPLSRPGGEAARLLDETSLEPRTRETLSGDIYPTIMRALVRDLAEFV